MPRQVRREELFHTAALYIILGINPHVRGAKYASVEAWLRGIDGIGPWSSGFILLRGIGRGEALPVRTGASWRRPPKCNELSGASRIGRRARSNRYTPGSSHLLRAGRR